MKKHKLKSIIHKTTLKDLLLLNDTGEIGSTSTPWARYLYVGWTISGLASMLRRTRFVSWKKFHGRAVRLF